MSISVVIVNWNGGKLLEQCLLGVLNQSHPAEKILLMDNGSRDGSAKRAAQIPGIEVEFLAENLGFAQANNLAFEQLDTEWVALLNPDAVPDKDWLLHLFEATRKYPDTAMLGSKQLQLRAPEKLDGIGDSYHLSGLMWRQGYGQIDDINTENGREIFSPCACAALYRLSEIKEIGGFDSDFFCYTEDVDLGFRLRLRGHKARYIANAKVFHAGSASTGSQHSDFALYHGHRNLVWTYLKNMPGILFWLCLPVHIALNVFSLAHFARIGKFQPLLSAKKDALSGVPAMWRKRWKIQSQRQVSCFQIWRCLDKSFIPRTKDGSPNKLDN